VRSKRCEHEGCDKHPSFNSKGMTGGRFCASHAESGMIDVINKRCEHEGCDKHPSFNSKGMTGGRFCMSHAEPGMVDIVTKRCATPNCCTMVKNKYDGYCFRCFVYLFPNKPVSHNYKTKEGAVLKFLSAQLPDKTLVADKRVSDGCSKRRPDICINMGTHVVMVECDENQHADYDCSCEHKRLAELWQDVGERPLVFVRFNPDEYTRADGSKVTSCWGYTEKRELPHVKTSKIAEWDQRLQHLLESVNYWIANVPGRSIETVELYYDGSR